MLFAEYYKQDAVAPTPPKSNINSNNHQQNPTPTPHSKFSDAEAIDYEEVK